jgi:signal transduction histidine kinase
MLLDIINDLLDLAKLEAGKLRLHVTEFDLGEVCQSLIDFLQPIAGKKQQTLRLDLGPDLPRFRSDSGKVRQILYNLLSNALKFTPEGGSIGLRVEAVSASPPAASLVVSDTGPGIPEEQWSAIFEKFKQLDSSVTREHGGTGLGLAITRDLVHLLGGRIDLASRVGHGSTFTITLPACVPEAAPPTPVPLAP